MAVFGKWCSVSDEKPREGQYVIAKTSGGHVEGGCIYRDGWFEYFGQVLSNVTAWMPLSD